MTLATQPTAWPTNKLMTGSGVSGIITAAWMEVVPTFAPALGGPAMGALVGFVVALAVGYFIPDVKNESAT